MNLENHIKEVIRNYPDFPKEGIMFRDITSLFLDAELSKKITKAFANHALEIGAEIVCGIESRGFLYGFALAQEAGLPFVLIRKKGKLPGKKVSCSYDLEYGSNTIELHLDDLPKDSKVLIHDDLLATGGSANAAAQLIKLAQCKLAGFSFIIELEDLHGRELLVEHSANVMSLVKY